MVRLLAGFIFVFYVTSDANAAAIDVQFDTRDGITIFGDLYTSSEGKSAPVILLFHQAQGEARGEYAVIASRLLENGYNILAIDQRSGGNRFGNENRTVMALEQTDYGYCDVYPDLEAALGYVRASGYSGPLAAWGSSYSAALVFQLAGKNKHEINAVLGFSPASGTPMADCALDQFLADLTIPALALRPEKEFGIESVKAQMKEFERFGVVTYVAEPGVHGSSMLSTERVGQSTEATWSVVLEFLASALVRE